MNLSTVYVDLRDLTGNVNQLAKAVVGLAQAVQSHHSAITELLRIQSQLNKGMHSDALEIKSPSAPASPGAKKSN